MQKKVYEDFRDATVALLEADDLPKGVRAAVDVMLDQFDNELYGNDEPAGPHAHRVMSKVFGLNGHAPQEDEDDPNDGRLQEFCRLYDAIEALPDAGKRLYQAKTVLELLAAGTDGVVDFKIDDEGDDRRTLTDREVEEMVDLLFANTMNFSEEADELAVAVVKVVDYFTYERSLNARETSKNDLNLALYRRTGDCARQLTNFERRAGCKNGD
jgi:hypothetical protein